MELEGLGAWVKLLQVHTVMRTRDSVGRGRPGNLTSRLLIELEHVSLRASISKRLLEMKSRDEPRIRLL